ncbi:MAG: hypothetical protein AVDCRST_MAG73-2976 [uncultured Thermomicrobiales bacterium]|uniref:Uncharacterized protein n=1 Tax=uncultured Thermomicrobiales bacterium TaxID=1645740 RepID=A0A6J4UML4_9BACT|nr:MAG: hypothetical protein AVDCRST_MAG73-2976 [uncultured Thermomicrobiales bacterium]
MTVRPTGVRDDTPPLPEYLTVAIDRLRAERLDGYAVRPFPDPADTWIGDFPEALLADPQLVEPEGQTVDSDRLAGRLSAHAVRMAPRAVRDRDSAPLRPALLALVLAFNGTSDRREILMPLALPWHSTTPLGVDPGSLYRDLAALPVGFCYVHEWATT